MIRLPVFEATLATSTPDTSTGTLTVDRLINILVTITALSRGAQVKTQ
jgi:hypothetical protein